MSEKMRSYLIAGAVYLVSKRHKKHPPFIYMLKMKKGIIKVFLIQNNKYRLPFPLLIGIAYGIKPSSMLIACAYITPSTIVLDFSLGDFHILPANRYHEIVQAHYFIIDFDDLLH